MWYFWIIIILILMYYFFNKRNSANNQHIKSEQIISIDNIVDGYEYFATLDPRTPLKALQHHGEIRKGQKSELPNYGNSRDGIWLEYFEDHSSQLEPNDREYLIFLTKFRSLYESDSPLSEKKAAISELIKKAGKSQKRNSATDWFLWDLLEIPGVSKSIARVLYSDGIKLKEDLKNASDEMLLNIPGIGPGRLKQIRTFFKTLQT